MHSEIQGEWDAPGIAVFVVKVFLCLSCWLSSDLYSPSALLENALTGYYLICLDVMLTYGHQRTSRNYLSATTARNMLFCAASLVERIARQDSATPFEPKYCMEDTAERWFGQIKQLCGPVPTFKLAMLATQRLHLSQRKKKTFLNCKQRFLPPAQHTGQRLQDLGTKSFKSDTCPT